MPPDVIDCSAIMAAAGVGDPAVRLHRAEFGEFPAAGGKEADFMEDLEQLLSGPFPQAEIGNVGATLRVESSHTELTPSGSQSWA